MNQPAEQEANEETFQELLKAFSPDLYLVYETQKLTKINWEIIREVIISMHDVASFGGSGEVRIFFLNGMNKAIQGQKNRKMEIAGIIE